MPNYSDPGAAHVVELIDDLCDRFEAAWLTGTPTPLEGVVSAAPEPVRPELFRELLAVEGEYRAKAHRPITLDEARERFAVLGSWAGPVIHDVFGATGSWADPAPPGVGRRSPPARVGKYELVARLGSGAHGTVYKAHHPELERFCVLKILSPPRSQTPETLGRFRRMAARFRRERVALARLNHANIIKATDGGEVGDSLYLVMEFVEGADLGRVLKAAGRLGVPEACEAVRQAAEGLAYVELNEMVHRDIKPSNLLLGRDGVVRILDLGLVRVTEPTPAERNTETGALMGTPDFISPEQARGVRNVDIRADVYSLGCTLYALLTGSPPFARAEFDSPYKKFKAHNDAPVPPLAPSCPDLPPGLEDLVLRMLQKEPAERPQSPTVVAQDIAPFCTGHNLARLSLPSPSEPLHGPTVTGERVPDWPTPRSPVPSNSTITESVTSRRRPVVVVVATVMLAAVAGVAIWLASRPKQNDPAKDPPPHDFRPGEWTELLDRDPKVVAWPEPPAVGDWRYDTAKRELRISHSDRAMFQLEDLQDVAPGFDMEMTVSQIPWTGGFGMYARGRDELFGGDKSVLADFLVLYTFTPELEPMEARMSRGVVRAVPRVNRATADRLNSQLVPRPHLEEHRVALSVTAKGIVQIRLDNLSIADTLVDPASQFPKRPGTAGSVGVLVQGSTTHFRSVRVRFHKPGESP